MSLATPNKKSGNNTPSIVVPSGRILLKETIKENKSIGGIILAGSSDPDNKTRIGEVIYNGVTINGFKSDLYREGCTIHFGKHSGAVVIHDNEKYISITESEVAAISY